MRWAIFSGSILGLLVIVPFAFGNAMTNGPDGINASGLGLTGMGTAIGQVEPGRPGLPGFDAPANVHSTVVPAAVFRRDGAPNVADAEAHAEQVAGIMVSTDATLRGVAPDSSLHASAYVTAGVPGYEHALLAIQQVATQPNVAAVNHSWGKPNAGTILDGNSQLTLGLDWSASQHDVLHVVAGNEGTAIPIPTDNFNGMTIAYSERVGNVWRRVGSENTFDEDAEGDRTSISLIAPGDGFAMTDLGDTSTTSPHPLGTSFAAPHVVGTVALLQQYGDERINAGALGWDADTRHHEVMKAVLMNSADKLIDDGSVTVPGQMNPVPRGGLLGMERTVFKRPQPAGPGQPAIPNPTWFNSYAYGDGSEGGGGTIPLDNEMGTGHLNASRARTQFAAGEYDSDDTDIPVIGWDYGTTTGAGDRNRYRFTGELLADTFISITLAWDREVTFDVDADADGEYDVGDTFTEYVPDGFNPPDDSVINSMVLYLLPKFATSISQYVAVSDAQVGTVQHLFFQIPETGEYEFWVRQLDADVGTTQDYAVAWWAVSELASAPQGDYTGDFIVDENDYNLWKADFGSTENLAADGNGNGIIDAADYTVWRDSLTAGSGSLASVAVPEPTAITLWIIGVVLCLGRSRRQN
jgi:hypothetical protein